MLNELQKGPISMPDTETQNHSDKPNDNHILWNLSIPPPYRVLEVLVP